MSRPSERAFKSINGQRMGERLEAGRTTFVSRSGSWRIGRATTQSTPALSFSLSFYSQPSFWSMTFLCTFLLFSFFFDSTLSFDNFAHSSSSPLENKLQCYLTYNQLLIMIRLLALHFGTHLGVVSPVHAAGVDTDNGRVQNHTTQAK